MLLKRRLHLGVRARLAGVTLLTMLALSACAQHAQSALHPAGPVSQAELGLMGFGFWIMLGVFVVVVAVLGYSLVRFRERRGDQGLPPQVEGNHRLEIAWTLIPIVLLALLIVPTFRATFALAQQQRGPGVVQVTVVGHQWWWEFDYPQLGIVTADEMHIPAGERVQLTLRSADVLHSFWVPALAGKEDTVPGQSNTMYLEAARPGLYPGQCAEFCGVSHSEMRFDVIAQTPSAFAAWVQARQHPDSTPATAQAVQGEKVFAQYGCGSCHTIDGTQFQGKVGPNLSGLGTRLTLAGASLQNTPKDLRLWVSDAHKIMPSTVMPNFSTMSSSDLHALSAYLEGLK